MSLDTPERDFTVAVFVVRDGAVLLHWHSKLSRWLPPGGHIEPNELPDEAALREVLEETGLRVELVCDKPNTASGDRDPVQLCRPAGIQLEDISAGHQHIDLIYFAIPPTDQTPTDGAFYPPESWESLAIDDELTNWCRLAIEAVSKKAQFSS